MLTFQNSVNLILNPSNLLSIFNKISAALPCRNSVPLKFLITSSTDHLSGLVKDSSSRDNLLIIWLYLPQGVIVCLFTAVGGVMLLVFCLIIIQECKVGSSSSSLFFSSLNIRNISKHFNISTTTA